MRRFNKNVILRETKNLTRSFTSVQDDNQTGRNMVEMLGVLAVVGVLSIAGVQGYTYAMNRHLANELLNEASKRATIVATQAMQGRTIYSTEEFTNNETWGFTGAIENPENSNQFQLTLENMDEKICTQIKTIAGGPIRDINSDCSRITYNKDLSSTVYASDFKTPEECASPFKWCSAASTPYCADDCCSGVTLNQCQESCNNSTGAITNKADTETCDYSTTEAADGKCDGNGSCVKPCSDWQNNTQCGGVDSGWYCQFSPTSYKVEPSSGVCQPVNYLGNYDTKTITIPYPAGTYEYTMTEGSTDWWSAYSWCKAFGKTMVSKDDIGCNNNMCPGNTTQIIAENLHDGCVWQSGDIDYRMPYACLDSRDVGTMKRSSSTSILCVD